MKINKQTNKGLHFFKFLSLSPLHCLTNPSNYKDHYKHRSYLSTLFVRMVKFRKTLEHIQGTIVETIKPLLFVLLSTFLQLTGLRQDFLSSSVNIYFNTHYNLCPGQGHNRPCFIVLHFFSILPVIVYMDTRTLKVIKKLL